MISYDHLRMIFRNEKVTWCSSGCQNKRQGNYTQGYHVVLHSSHSYLQQFTLPLHPMAPVSRVLVSYINHVITDCRKCTRTEQPAMAQGLHHILWKSVSS